MLKLADSWIWDAWYVDDGENFHLFFLRASRALLDSDQRHFHASIGHAISKDLMNWELLADALLPSESPAWDDLATWTGSIILAPDNRWHLFYTGVSRRDSGEIQRIGHAISDDLITWSKVGEGSICNADARWYEVHSDGIWREEAWRDPWVFHDPDGEGYHMLITARNGSGAPLTRGVVGHAISNDLNEWKTMPPLSLPNEFAHLEVLQVEVVEGNPVLIFCCAPDELSEKRRIAESFAGTYTAPASSLLGPFDLDNAELIDAPQIYAGRIIRDRMGGWNLLGFYNLDESGSFVGAICDPIPLFLTERGTLQIRK